MFVPQTASTARGALSVASFSNTVFPVPQIPFTFSVDGKQSSRLGYQPAFPNNWPEKPLPLYVVGLSTDAPGDLCRPPPADTPDLSNYIVAITGDCSFAEMFERATQLGAKYLLFYHRLITPAFINWSDLNIEAAGLLLMADANSMIAPLKSGSQVIVDMQAGGDMFVVNVENSYGGAVAKSSTQGPTFEGDLKPQIGAPGEAVLSTMMVSRGSYAVWGGTSFSCPFIAGVIALLIEARGPTSPAEMEQLLMTHAKQQVFNDRTNFYDYLAPVPQQGAGLVQAYDSAFSTLAVQPPSIALNDSEHAVTKVQITLHNTGKKAVTYNLSHVPAGTSYTLAKDSIYPVLFPGDIVKTYGSLRFSQGSVTLAAGQKTTVDVMPTAPQGLVSKRLPVWSGYIAVNGSDGSSATVAYQGIAGSLRAATVLGADAATVLLDDGTAAPSNTTFLLPTPGRESGVNAKLPTLNARMALGTRIIRADIVPHGQESIGQLDGFPIFFQSRSSVSISWDGKLANGQFAPAGTYTVAFSALRLNGDEEKDEDWDRAETAPFGVQYQ
ncbi:subtilisin-like protein [Trichoderma barbatum]